MKSFLPFILLGACLGMYFLFISPQLSQITSLREKMSEHADVLAKTAEIETKRDAAQAAYDSIPSEDIAKLAKIVPTVFDGVTFANDLSFLAAKNSLKLSNFKSEVAQTAPRDVNSEVTIEEKPYRTITTTMHLDGTYEHFISFLEDLEHSLHLIDVNNITISRAGDASKGEVSLAYDVQLSSYSLQ